MLRRLRIESFVLIREADLVFAPGLNAITGETGAGKTILAQAVGLLLGAPGDAGYLEPDGHLVVLGRLSEVVHTAQGERYIPNYIENRLKFSPWIKDVAVLGKGRERLSAIVCIDKDPVGHWAELRGISYMSYADLSQKPEVIDLVKAAVQRVNATLPEGLKLRHFVSLHKEFDADDGEITRTRKLRRNVVEERYAPIIDAVYAGQSSVTMKAQIVYETGEVGVTERNLRIMEA